MSAEIQYRIAQRADWPRIDPMLRAFLVEQRAAGSSVLVSNHNILAYRLLCEDYLSGRRAGVVVLAESDGQTVGFALAGEPQSVPWLDTDLARPAVVWIAWVDSAYRKQRLGLGMLVYGRPFLLDLGFETATMGVREENEEGKALCRAYGAHDSERLLLIPLREEPGHG